MSTILASVAVPRPVRRLFTYVVPPALVPRCRRGVRVIVPFGSRKLTGYLLELSDAPSGPPAGLPSPRPVEEVLDPDPVLDDAILELTRWASEYYVVSWGEMIRTALPGMQAVLRRVLAITTKGREALAAGDGALVDPTAPRIARDPRAREILAVLAEIGGERGAALRLQDLKKRLRSRFRPSVLRSLEHQGLIEVTEFAAAPGPRPRMERHARLLESGGAAAGAGLRTGAGREPAKRLGGRQMALLRALQEAGGRMAVPVLLARTGAPGAALRSLRERGLIAIEAEEARRRPLSLEAPAGPAPVLEPTPDQRTAIDAIRGALDEGRFATCLLQGVTGSGKTEVYQRAIEAAVSSGRRALYLVPEIGLTPLLARRLRARFGEVLALLHSGLSEGERYDEWRRIREGRVDVVLGARSAVFAPLPGLGLIVVDEEHDASYKQDESPRYNGRDLAIMRGKMAGAVVVLGSATPSMESYHQAMLGRYRLLRLPERIGAAGLPRVEMVDMRREFEEIGRESILSRRLLAALQDRVARREQSLVLLNRRGFSTFALCRACGETVTCRRCSITLTLHLGERRLRCHYCDESRRVPESCPACGSPHLHFGGTGTERLEEALRAAIPSARLLRMDRDTVSGRGSVEGILTRFERGEVDILLGTQMIAKGHDFPNVTLVGVLAADALLGMPDFRAGERTFQLLAQVAGRSGRGDRPGEVIVQAYHTDHHAIRAACAHDFEAFARGEMEFRRAANYPPHSALALLLVKDRVFDRARAGALAVAGALRAMARSSLKVFGPAPAPLERLRGEYRVQVLVKATSRKQMQEALAELLGRLDRRTPRLESLVIDVDPMSTL